MGKRGSAARTPLKSEMLFAQDQSKSAAEAARRLDISYKTYKKWAKAYGIFDRLKNQSGVGVRKGGNNHLTIPLDEIFAGNCPNYKVKTLQERIIRNGYMKEECSNCGFHEQRVTDFKVPLKLNHIDGDITNHRFDNLELLCYNCWFLMVGRNFWG